MWDNIIRPGDKVWQCLSALCERRWTTIKKHPNRKNCKWCGEKLYEKGTIISVPGMIEWPALTGGKAS